MWYYMKRSVIRAPILAGKIRLLEDTSLWLLCEPVSARSWQLDALYTHQTTPELPTRREIVFWVGRRDALCTLASTRRAGRLSDTE